MLERHTARIWMLRDDSLVSSLVASDIPRHVSGLLAPVLWQTSGLDGMAEMQGVPVDDDGGEQVEAGDAVMLPLCRTVADLALATDP